VTDHAPLLEAAKCGDVIPLYIVEPEYWKLPDTSGRQWLFIKECLESLRADLKSLGTDLIVQTGNAPQILKALIKKHNITNLVSHEETGNLWTYERDKAVSRMVADEACEWTEYPQFGVQRGPTNRDKWSKAWDAFMTKPIISTPKILKTVSGLKSDDIPSQVELGMSDACPGRQKGGRKAGLLTLESFLNERGENYRKGMSSPLSAEWQCSRLSTFLSTGTISMREAAQALWVRQKELKDLAKLGEETGTWRGSMSSYNGRLHWHCHFTQKLEDEPRQEIENIHPFYDDLRDNSENDMDARERLLAWSEGRTGLPFVDACMRSLNATGWINFRMRAMLMAVSSYSDDMECHGVLAGVVRRCGID